MRTSRTRVVSARIPVADFVAMVAEAEAKNCSVAEVILSSWRDRKSREPIELRLRKIEQLLTDIQTEQSSKFQRLAEAFNQLISARR